MTTISTLALARTMRDRLNGLAAQMTIQTEGDRSLRTSLLTAADGFASAAEHLDELSVEISFALDADDGGQLVQ